MFLNYCATAPPGWCPDGAASLSVMRLLLAKRVALSANR
jgi:hypothetical protein